MLPGFVVPSPDFDLFDPVVKNGGVREIHIAMIGADGSGKSALTVKYLTRRYISEYDSNIEDTYCKHEKIQGEEFMIWVMDTVEAHGRHSNRYLGWADVFFVVYAINNKQSFEYAEHLLKMIAKHDHSLCTRPHTTCLLGNKSDLDRYRQVSKNQGEFLAASNEAEFFETNATEEYSIVKTVFHRMVARATNQRARLIPQHSPSPKNVSSDPETKTKPQNLSPHTLPGRSKSPAAKFHEAVKDKFQGNVPTLHPPPQKRSSALKLLKIFQ